MFNNMEELLNTKVYIKTFGCQMNERDSAELKYELEERGCVMVDNEKEADIVIVNTCCVREKAEEKAIGKIRSLLQEGKTRVGVIGCMAQMRGINLLKDIPGISFVFGTHSWLKIPNFIKDVIAGKINNFVDVDDERLEVKHRWHAMADGVVGFVNIIFGCNKKCSFCVVPTTRSSEWSRLAADVIDEVQQFVAKGGREVVLLGQDVMAYGKRNKVWDMESRGAFNEPFPRLLEELSKIDGLKRIRFTAGHPAGCTEELARAIRDLQPVCEHIHLPLQSGCNRILKLMRRGYSKERYLKVVELLRGYVPQIAITTDIIVGFPTETEAEFEETIDFCNQIDFDGIFVFKYSPRQGTEASKFKDDISFEEKLRRNKILLSEQNARSLRKNKEYIGKCVEVLVEGISHKNRERWQGRTREGRIVIFNPDSKVKPGDLVNVRIKSVTAYSLYGEIESGKQ